MINFVDVDRPRTGAEWEALPPDKRPRFWTTRVVGGIRYRVDQLIFKTNDDAIDYVKKELPLEWGVASAIWTAAENRETYIRGYLKGLEMKVNEFPFHMREGVMQYVRNGRPTGDFLRSVFEGDLFLAARRADGSNRPILADWGDLAHLHLPPGSVGSAAKVDAWMKRGGLLG